MIGWIAAAATVIVVAVGVWTLLGRRSPARLSDEEGKTPRRRQLVVDRPAGPDAEEMDPDAALGPDGPGPGPRPTRRRPARRADRDGPG